MILKIQVSLETTHEEPQVLIYDIDRRLQFETPLRMFTGLKEQLGDDKRAFFEARVSALDGNGNVSINLIKKLPEQGW